MDVADRISPDDLRQSANFHLLGDDKWLYVGPEVLENMLAIKGAKLIIPRRQIRQMLNCFLPYKIEDGFPNRSPNRHLLQGVLS